MRSGISSPVSTRHAMISKFLTYLFPAQKIAVEERGILHRDCSLNNSIIEDDGNGSHGTMIDWEFAVRILQSNHYPISGTVSVLLSDTVFNRQLLTK